jgi:hypothetical protein
MRTGNTDKGCQMSDEIYLKDTGLFCSSRKREKDLVVREQKTEETGEINENAMHGMAFTLPNSHFVRM